ncbi:sensor histidine kinase [Kitasatospora sp. NPDC050543]|uniref:sensor histidine kinase n=1 Tax=Kitasatospora sp. NPDC050543 TaxID=3364054 RepID=UPI0037B90551
MEAIAKAWPGWPAAARTLSLRRLFPGPWGAGLAIREGLMALLLGGLCVPGELLDHAGGLRLVLVPSGVALLYLLRRALPGTSFVLVATAGGALLGLMPAMICAAWSAGYRMTRARPLIGAFAAAFLLSTLTSFLSDGNVMPAKGLLGVTLAAFLLLAVLPALAGRYRAQRRTLLTALRERNEQLLRERTMVAHQARLRERHRIAQDMHDSLGHQLALVAVHSGALEVDRTLTDPQREAVGVLRQAAVAAMRELREVVGVLHDESAPAVTGGVDGIDRLADTSRAAGAAVALSRSGEGRTLPAATGHAAFRIVQEALTNAHKHAPAAPISVALRYEPDALVVEVANGPAPGAAGAEPGVSGGQGLTGLRERARLVGGMVHAGPTPDGGYRLAAVLPYDGAAAGGESGADDDEGFGELYGEAGLGLTGADPLRDALTGKRRRSPAVGCAIGAVLVVLAILGLTAWGVVAMVDSFGKATVGRSTYDALELGTPEAEARAKLPEGARFLTQDYEGTGPTPPTGAGCEYFISSGFKEDAVDDYVLRFCFKDGRLVDKQHYRAKV